MFLRAMVTLRTLLVIVLKCFWIANIKYKKKVITFPKKTFVLVLPYLGPLSLQTRAKLIKYLKVILNCCKLHIVLESQNKLAKARIPKDSF